MQHKIKQEAEQFRQWKASREKELLQVLELPLFLIQMLSCLKLLFCNLILFVVVVMVVVFITIIIKFSHDCHFEWWFLVCVSVFINL